MENRNIVPRWTYWLFLPIVIAIIYSFVIRSFPDWMLIMSAVCILSFSGIVTYYYAKAKMYRRIFVLWICLITTFVTIWLSESVN